MQSLVKFLKTPSGLFLSCLFGGGLSALAMAPYQIVPTLMLGLSVLYLALVHAPSRRTAFISSWAWGFGYFVIGLNWIGNALLVDGNPYAWAWPLAVCGLPLILGLYFGLAGFLAKALLRLNSIRGFMAFASLFMLAEILRGYMFTGFPWNLFGYAWSDMLPVLQIVYYTDIYWLSFLTLIWLALPGFLIAQRHNRKKAVLVGAFGILSFTIVYAAGAWRLDANPVMLRDDVRVNIVQPNIDQADKWDGSQMAAHVLKHLEFSRAPDGAAGITTFVIWPETAISYHFFRERLYPDLIGDTLKSYAGPAFLLTGLLDYNETDQSYANALVLIDENGQTIDRYAKTHLVPFGEYIPYQSYIPLKPVAQFSGFQQGEGPKIADAGNSIFYAPSVCYEGIFPNKQIPPGAKRPDFLVNVTNDAWYGMSAGPYQHFAHTRMRAIEEGAPMVRAANTGISGIIDPYGRIIVSTALFTETSTTAFLPRALKSSSRGNSLNLIVLLLILFLLAFLGSKADTQGDSAVIA